MPHLPVHPPTTPGRVLGVAFDEDLIISSCSQGAVRLWSMDELKPLRTGRHHLGAATAVLLHHGVPCSGGEDGSVAVWDGSGASGAPIVVLEVAGPVAALAAANSSGEGAARGCVGCGLQ
jgi:WD40 repeat protein